MSFARPGSEQIKGANLYINGLPKTMSQQDFEKLFAPYGAIVTSRLLLDNITGKLTAKRCLCITVALIMSYKEPFIDF